MTLNAEFQYLSIKLTPKLRHPIAFYMAEIHYPKNWLKLLDALSFFN